MMIHFTYQPPYRRLGYPSNLSSMHSDKLTAGSNVGSKQSIQPSRYWRALASAFPQPPVHLAIPDTCSTHRRGTLHILRLNLLRGEIAIERSRKSSLITRRSTRDPCVVS